MRRNIFFIILFLNITHVSWLVAQEKIQILVGQSKTIKVPVGSKVLVGNQDIASARAIDGTSRLVITGQSKGETSLTIYLPGGQVHEKFIQIIDRDPRSILAEIKDIYGSIEGVKLSVKGGKLVAEGKVYTIEDMNLLNSLVEQYGQPLLLVEDRSEKPMFNVKVQFVEVDLTSGTDF